MNRFRAIAILTLLAVGQGHAAPITYLYQGNSFTRFQDPNGTVTNAPNVAL